ncbi:hypothetical protein Vretimale_11592 [Volvox reticuliferus]|nr:hypothetical protein Vretimale_11592 [Volvox reticuliferus]
MHLLDFIFRVTSAPTYPNVPAPTSRDEAEAPSCSSSPPLDASTAPRSSSLPPYVQLYQPRQPAVLHTLGLYTPSSGQARSKALVHREASSSSISLEVSTASPRGEPSACTSDNVTATLLPTSTVANDTSSNPATAADPEATSEALSLSLKDCRSRACAGVVDSFRKAMRPGGEPKQAHAVLKSSPSLNQSGESDATVMTGTQAEVAATGVVALSMGSTAAGGGTSGPGEATGRGAGGAGGDNNGCPPDTWQLGRATWTFLHSVAAHYPEHPSQRQQELMRGMMEGLAEFYPCEICAEHLREQVQRNPPQVATARDLNLWLCGIHNEVNEILGKPLFDCKRLLERWRDGPPDGSCD